MRFETPAGRQGEVSLRDVGPAVGPAARTGGRVEPLAAPVAVVLPPADDGGVTDGVEMAFARLGGVPKEFSRGRVIDVSEELP